MSGAIGARRWRPTPQLLVLLCVSVPSFMINLDANVVAVSLPAIAQDLKADFVAIEWVMSAYTLAFASLVLPAGMLADRYGRKGVLIGGFATFVVASLLCGAAPTIAVLNLARTLQGAGAALLLSAALATLSHDFRGPERAHAFAFWGALIGIAITLGPVIGGLITETLGWRWIFYLNVPVGVAMIALTIRAVRDSRDPEAGPVDAPGSLLFAAALLLVTHALIAANHLGWGHPRIAAEIAGSGVLLAAFLTVESRRAHPMLDLSFFKRPTYIGANLAGLAFAAALLPMLTFLPLYFHAGFGVAPQTAGLMMLPIAVPLFVVPRLTARYLTPRVSGRVLLTGGLCLVAAGLIWLAWSAAGFDYPPVVAGMVVAGVGAGILNSEIAKVSMTAVPAARSGMAAGVGGTVRFAGLVVGFAALGAVLLHQVKTSVAASFPDLAGVQQSAIAQRVVAGDVSGAMAIAGARRDLLQATTGAGYHALFLSAALVALAAAAATWLLVRAADTAPLGALGSSRQTDGLRTLNPEL